MTFETTPNAPADAIFHVEQLHEFAVNNLGYMTDEVLFVAHDDGTITGRIASDAGRDSFPPDPDADDNPENDPDPPDIAFRPSADAETDVSPDSAHA